MSSNILNPSPTGLVPSNLDVRPRSGLNVEFSPMRNVPTELRLSPVQLPHSPPCYCPDDGRKVFNFIFIRNLHSDLNKCFS